MMIGSDFFSSHVIEDLTGSAFSHVGMVVRADDGELYFWEAIPEAVLTCLLDGTTHAGCHLIPLEPLMGLYVKHTGGKFVFRHLEVDRDPVRMESFWTFAREVNKFPFSGEWDMALEWAEGHISPVAANENKFFCSELVAATYQRMNLLPSTPPANEYAPASFSMRNKSLELLEGAKLSEEILVVWGGHAASA